MAKQDTINDLREILNPSFGIVPQLTLNKHFSKYNNLSLFDAKNIRFSSDNAVLQNEESLVIDETVHNFFKSHFSVYKIVGCINTPNELIFFVLVNTISGKTNNLLIIRYKPDENLIGVVYGRYTITRPRYYRGITYHGGKFSGSYTYNVDNSLIIAWCEYDCNDDYKSPMMTLNLGQFGKDFGYIDNDGIWVDETVIPNDRTLNESKLSIVPEVELPRITSVDYVSGEAYNAWYYIYIRYKINKFDYTQWYSIGFPIYVLNVNNLTVVDLEKHRLITQGVDGSDKIGKTFQIDLDCIDTNYSKYQLGFIVINKTLNKHYITSDIDVNDGTFIDYKFDINTLTEEQIDITKYFNYFNVKNIINYRNKLYISNYEETPVKKIDVSSIHAKLDFFNNINENYKYDVIKDTNVIIRNWSNTILWLYNVIDYKDITQELTIECFPEFRNYQINGAIPIENTIKSITCDINDLTILRQNKRLLAHYVILPFSSYSGYTDYYAHLYTVNVKDTQFNNLYKLNEIYTEDAFNSDLLRISKYGCAPDGSMATYTYYKDTELIGYFRIKNSRGKIIYLSLAKQLSDFSFISSSLFNNTFDSDTSLGKHAGDLIFDKFTRPYLHTQSPDILNSNNFPNSNGQDRPYDDDTYKHMWIVNPQDDGSIPQYSKDSIDINIIKNEDYLTNNAFCNTTLIPGGIYDFYIHFVDKYGLPTQGYKLDNLYNIYLNDDNGYCILDVYGYKLPGTDVVVRYFALIVKADENVLTIGENVASLNIDKVKLVKFKEYTSDGLRFTNIVNDIDKSILSAISSQMYSNLINHLTHLIPNEEEIQSSTDYARNKYLKFYQIANNYSGYFTETLFKAHNNFGEVIWKVPMNFVLSDKFYSMIFKNIENVLVANNYNSFFISYKKYEENQKIIGIGDENGIINEKLNIDKEDYNCDILLKLNDVNSLIDIQSQPITEDAILISFTRNFYEGLNAVQNLEFYAINKHRIGFAGEYATNRLNKHSLYLTNNELELNLIDTHHLILGINYNNLAYHDKNEYLFRAGNIVNENNASNYTINSGFNGVCGYEFCLRFNEKGVIYNHGLDSYIVKRDDLVYYDASDYTKVSYMATNIKIISETLYNSKYFNNPFTLQLAYEDEEDGVGVRPIKVNTIANAGDTLDLFEHKLPTINEFNPEFYLQYDEDSVYKYQFDNMIRFSNVISDESRFNSWRKFNTNDYKVITENKGKIVSLNNIGDWIFIHNEHALFSIQFKDSLKTENENLQIRQSSITDLAVKEMIPSNNGFGGLQDKLACVIGDFGYIFYENDTKRFYRIDAGKFAFIDEDIKEYIKTLNIKTVRFAWDKRHNRILIDITYYEDVHDISIKRNITLSYNYYTGTFISFHDYNFNNAYITKDLVYIVNNDKGSNSFVRKFADINFNYYEYLSGENILKTYVDSTISFIYNLNYFSEKYLEYLDYKIKLYNDIKDKLNYDKTYAGNKLTVYNDLISTTEMNIVMHEGYVNKIEDYDRPHRNLGYWSINNLRDIKNIGDGQAVADVMSRLYGNFFIGKFVFDNKDIRDKLLLFENIKFNVSSERN